MSNNDDPALAASETDTTEEVEREQDRLFMDLMSRVSVGGRARMVAGGLCAAVLLEWIVELMKDQVEENKQAEKNAHVGPTLRQICFDGFVKLKLSYALGMTMLNETELDVALDNLIERKIIVVNWPEEEFTEDEAYPHCWVRLNIKRMKELEYEILPDGFQAPR